MFIFFKGSKMNRKLLLGGLSLILTAVSAYALPAFARQTGLDCMACHFQHYPSLNNFGRSFKAAGYTMTGKQGLIDGDRLSLSEVLNAGITTKIRYQKSNGPTTTTNNDTTNDGQLKFPDELLLQFAGRISENIGFMTDINLNSGDESVIESFKMSFIYNVLGINVGAIPFTTGTQGVAYGFELLNTGALRGQRVVEARKTFSAQQYIGTATMAEGAAFVASNSLFFVNVSMWSPRSVDSQTDGSPTATYIRAAITPMLGEWDLGAGVQYWTGTATQDSNVTDIGENIDTKAWAIDAQAQGYVGTFPLGVYFSHAQADASTAGSTNLFNSGTDNAKTATALSAELGVMPERATLTLGYRIGDNGQATNSSDDGVLLAASYQIVRNVQLQFNHEIYLGDATDNSDKGNQLTTIMLFASF